jgi:L,D-transpeptidase YcbB
MHKSIMIAAMTVVIAAPALAQVGPNPALKPAVTRAPAQAPVAASRVSQSPLPTLDEGTVERIAGAMLSLSALEVQGGWPTLPPSVGKLGPGARGSDVALLRARLAITEDLPAALAEGDAYDDALAAAVRRFQVRHGLPETGSVGAKTLAALNVPVGKRLRQLAASLDRLVAMDVHFGQRYVVVNLPAASAEAVEGNEVVRRYVTVVGKPDRPSPTLTTYITAVNLNPTWTVPLSIMKKDVITRMRKDVSYVERMHMRVLDGQGRELDPRSIDWNSDRAPNFTIRQDSGS